MVVEHIVELLTVIINWMRTTTINIDTYSFTIMDVSIWVMLACLAAWAIWALFGD